MKIKLIYLSGLMTVGLACLAGCASQTPKSTSAVPIPEYENKSENIILPPLDGQTPQSNSNTEGTTSGSDTATLQQLFYSKDFATTIAETRPRPDGMPTAVVLMHDNFKWTNPQVMAKNKALCNGFLDLPNATDIEQQGTPKQQQVITYMPIKDRNNLVSYAKNCDFLLKKYNYLLSELEIERIFEGKIKGKGPFLAVYDPKNNPNTSMILDLGSLSPLTIEKLSNNWPRLINLAQQEGSTIDPVIALAVLVAGDPELNATEREDMLKNIDVFKKGVMCGGALVASTISLTAILNTPACKTFIDEAKHQLFG